MKQSASCDQLGRRALPPGLRAQLTKDAAKSTRSRHAALTGDPGRGRGSFPVYRARQRIGQLCRGATAVAGLRPPGEVASQPLASPVILNGVGSAKIVLPDAPGDAVYLRVELTCFDGIRCHTPGGGIEGADNGLPKVQGDALPLTDAFDPRNAQRLAPLNPADGLAIDVSPGTHWRLYAVYTDSINPKSAPLGDDKTLGIPGNGKVGPNGSLELNSPDLVPGCHHRRQVRLGGRPARHLGPVPRRQPRGSHRAGPAPAHAGGDQPGPHPGLRRRWHHRDRQGRRQCAVPPLRRLWPTRSIARID